MSKKISIFMALLLMALVSIIGIGKIDAAVIAVKQCDKSVIRPASGSIQHQYFIINSVWNEWKEENNNTPGDHFTSYVSDSGHLVYCVERSAHYLNNSDNPNYIASAANVNSDLVARALAYGYQENTSTPTCNNNFLATQLIVWLATKQQADGGFNILSESSISKSTLSSLVAGSSASTVVDLAYNLLTEMRNHEVIPSFAYASVEAAQKVTDKPILKYSEANRNFSGSMTDTKAVFSKFKLGSNPANVTATQSGNTLTITSKDDSVTTPISMSRTYSDGGTVYTRKGTRIQTTKYFVPKYKTVVGYAPYQYEKIGKGTVKIHKIDKYTGKNMKGATFGIFSDDACSKKAVNYLGKELPAKKSDKNGLIEWNNLYYPLVYGQSRTYYVKEIDPILEGYALDSDQLEKLGAKNNCIPVKVTADYIDTSASPNSNKNTKAKTTTLETTEDTKKTKQVLAGDNKELEDKEVVVQAVYNIPYGNVTILKTDAETKKVIPGVEFQLLKNNPKKEPAVDIHGNVVKNVKTDERGIAEFVDIPYGDYILVEVKADSWYKILEEPYEFTLSKENDALKYKSQGSNAIPEKDEIMIENEKYRLGDPTNDGKIDAEDIKVIEDIIAKKIEETKIQFYASDVNKDNNVDENDKALLQKYIDGDKTSIPDALKEFEYETYQKRVTISLTNKPIDMKISKVDITNEKEIKGAKIEIKNEKGETFLKYKSDGTPRDFAIPIGDYTLTETLAPKGYQTLKTEVKFRVLTDGNIKLISAKSNLYKLEKSKEKDDTDLDHLKIYNSPKKISVPNTGSVVAISTIVGGLLLIGGGSYIIYRKYKMI